MNFKSFFSNIFKKSTSNLGWESFFIGANDHKNYFGIVYSCIDVIANSISEVNFYTMQGDKEVDNEVMKLLKKPNDYQTGKDFFYLASTYLDMTGNFFIYPVKGGFSGKVIELHLLNSNNVKIITNKKSPIYEVLGYQYSKDGLSYTFNKEDIIMVNKPNPYNPLAGLSTIQMAKYDIDSEFNAVNTNNVFYENGASPSGVIKIDHGMTKETFAKLKGQTEREFTGKKNFFKLMFLTEGMDYKSISPSQRDMQYIEQRKLNRDQIISIFKVPKSMLGISDGVNRATAYEENLAFYKSVIKPRLDIIFDNLNYYLMPKLDSELMIKYDPPKPTDEVQELDEKTASVNVWKTVNEIREIEGFDPIEGGDELTSNVIEVEPTEEPEEPEEEESKKKEVIHKELLPNPKDVSGVKHKEFIRRRNAYIKYKENQLALELEQHILTLSTKIKKKSIKKDILQDFELSEEKIFNDVVDSEEREEWKFLLLLLILRNKTQAYKTAQKQLNEVYGFETKFDDTQGAQLNQKSTVVAKSISDTLFKKIKKTISDEVANGETSTKEIKKKISYMLNDVKQWKADQISSTEIANALSDANNKAYRDNGIEKIKWICGVGACEICQQNCNKIRGLNELFPSGNERETVHPHCKCVTIPIG